MKDEKYTCVNTFPCNGEATMLSDVGRGETLPSESAVYERRELAQVASRPPTHFELHNARRAFRREFGHFVARETGTKYQPSCQDYEPRSRERAPRREEPLTEATVATQRAALRHDLASQNPERKSSTLEGIYRWLAEYGNLTPQERDARTNQADAESVARLTVRIAGSKSGDE